MRDSHYWNPRHETLPRAELDELQLRKLRRLVGWADGNVPFQAQRLRAAGVTADELRTLDDVRRIPFFTREEWMREQGEHPPYGPVLAADPAVATRYHTTSGTSGRTPIRTLDSMKDWEWITEMWCYAFWGFGVRPRDTVFFAFSYGVFIGFWGAHYASEKLGCLTLSGGNMTTEARVRLIHDAGVTTVCSTPTYALRMAQEAEKLGIDLRSGPVDKLILSGEAAGSIPATKRLIEEQWGAKVGDTAGMTEVGTIIMFECDHQPGGAHIIEDHVLEEVIEPEGETPVPYGEEGERVVTSFGRGFIPLLRYRTGDRVLRVPGDRCTCGRTFDLYEGGIRGRVDEMKVVRGTNVYPRAVEAIVREYEGIDEFQVHLYTAQGIRDEIELLVEFHEGRDHEGLVSELSTALAEAHEGLRFPVRVVESGTLPRFELKAKRTVDDREVIGGGGRRRDT